MVETNFSGPIMAGRRVPVSAPSGLTINTTGTIPTVRRIAVSADGVYAAIHLPACHITRIWMNTEVLWASSAGESAILRVGTSADADQYGDLLLSAVGTRDINASARAFLSLAEGTTLVADVTTVGTAGIGQGHVIIEYMQTS